MNRKMIGEAIYIRFMIENKTSTDQSRAEGNNTECVGKKRFNGRVLPTTSERACVTFPLFCFWTRYYIFFSYGYL
jgi:hypothetical protein